ncbi:hypothetical protein [Methanobacterium alcaliphilum]|uniref:hypothetical protein n=1 Tax=Methanobacterium alcaliphilum TaxID=392018 RepID=UPI00200AF288|nr:hypothetical protein [Methanobacterium alcaliphilum]MCK9152192.1 hypothetical protein [Methanobacterium alcaliphilum]
MLVETMKNDDKAVKNENESCFLPNNDGIYYNSLMVFELIEIEKFDDLLSSFNDIFDNFESIDYSTIENIELNILNHKNSLFKEYDVVLPFINSTKIKKRFSSNRVYHDLGEYINAIQIIIHGTSPSTIILNIRALLNEKASDDLNSIIYKNHDPLVKAHSQHTRHQNIIYTPKQVKTEEVSELRSKIKKDLINFLKGNGIDGYFINPQTNPNQVPGIDLLSFDTPDRDYCHEWALTNENFLHCFNTSLIPEHTFTHENFILTNENLKNEKIRNYILFSPYTIDPVESLEHLKNCGFPLIAFKRWFEIQEIKINSLNQNLSKDLMDNNNTQLLIKTRSDIYNDLHSFKRFKEELESGLPLNKCYFENITSNSDFFNELQSDMIKYGDSISEKVDTYLKASDSTLKLRAIQSNEKTQNRILYLSYAIIFMILLQVGLLIIANKEIIFSFL